MSKRILLGVTGASGIIYATRLSMHLKNLGHPVDLILTKTAEQVLKHEAQEQLYKYAHAIFPIDDYFKEPASGSSSYSAMVVAPCSMGSLAKISAGIADNLLLRSADVCLKERRPLVLVPREMPYNAIHLQNMQNLEKAGASIISASPSFYRNPKTIEDLVDTVVAKVLSHIHVTHSLAPDWGTHV
ncbi:MAG: UbiX family flavin prenyltransferase [Fibrobacter sp.]|jgi:4-hydroxy-3-polyprenylbenzoate decarboxylase|nr:UbiX family flavin prenyltransferase [Fibrobacter sp.]